MSNKNKWIEKIFRNKQKARTKIANLSVEEKLQMLIAMQKATGPILRARGLPWKPWMTSELFQVKDRFIKEHPDTIQQFKNIPQFDQSHDDTIFSTKDKFVTTETISIPFAWKGLT